MRCLSLWGISYNTTPYEQLIFSLSLLRQDEGLTSCCFSEETCRSLVLKYAPFDGNITGGHCYCERCKGSAFLQNKVVPVGVD